MIVGFIGTGAMGAQLALNLQRAGHHVEAWDSAPGALDGLKDAGVEVAESPRALASCDAVLSMLPNDEAIREVFLEKGLLEALERTAIHVNFSTASVALAKEMAERHQARGVAYVASPVFGRPDAAASAELHLIVAGSEEAVARVTPLLSVVGKRVWYIGAEPHKANLVKIAGNLMIASAIEAMSEAKALGIAYEIDPTQMLDLYLEVLFPSPVYRGYANLIKTRKFEPSGFRLKHGLKDVRLALAAGDAANVPLPVASILRDAFLNASALGYDEKDWSSVSDIALLRSGQKLQP